jgi:precorrin-6B methylase 2
MSTTSPSPEKILKHTMLAHATAAAVGAAVTHALFTHIEEGADTPETLAERAGLSRRGTLALLDALCGIGLIEVSAGRYRNSPEASLYLVTGKPTYLGEHARMVFSPWGQAFRGLPDVVRTGTPNFPLDAGVEDTMFWEDLVLAVAPFGRPVAHIAASRVDLEGKDAPAILDVGGGSGIYAVEMLRAHPRATVTQSDWPKVNAIARDFVARFGFADRFRTLDGDFHAQDFGEAAYDAILYSNIAQQESAEQNVEMFRKLRQALTFGGTLVVSDFILEDDRTGSAWAGVFHTFMLLRTPAGATWRKADFRTWLGEAGFRSIVFEATPTVSTLIFAR